MSRVSPTIYLAGPITGCSYGEAVDWREEARAALAPHGITCFSPMRGKQYLEKERVLRGDPEAYMETELSSPHGIVARDRFDCTTSDLVLANLLPAEETGITSIGTMIEFGWADLGRVPIIAVMSPKTNPHWHAMVTELAGWVVDSLDSGLLVARAILLPDPAPTNIPQTERA
jgi:nucleoside 2-deoxyribosyltransferase